MSARLLGPRTIALLAIAVLVAACSGGGGAPAVRSLRPAESVPGATAASLDPNAASCKLITDEEARVAFNQTFTPAKGTDGEPASCVYFNSAGFGLRVEISQAGNVAETFESERAGYGAAAKDLPGVGDKAFYANQGASVILFLKGPKLVTLYTASRIEERVFKDLAKVAAGRA